MTRAMALSFLFAAALLPGVEAIADFDIAFKDSNGTDLRDGEMPEMVLVSFKLQHTGRYIEISVPSSLMAGSGSLVMFTTTSTTMTMTATTTMTMTMTTTTVEGEGWQLTSDDQSCTDGCAGLHTTGGIAEESINTDARMRYIVSLVNPPLECNGYDSSNEVPFGTFSREGSCFYPVPPEGAEAQPDDNARAEGVRRICCCVDSSFSRGSQAFTERMQSVCPVSAGGEGRRLEHTAVYGRRLAVCSVQTATAGPCGSGTGTCLILTFDRDCGPGDTVSVDLSAGSTTFNALPASNVAVTVQLFNSGGGAVPGGVASQVVSILTQAGVAISDPITFFRGKKTKFWLPLQGKHLLLQTQDLAIFASVFGGPSADLQWFDRFFIRLPDGRKVAEIGVERASLRQNRTSSRRHHLFRQLSVKLGDNAVPSMKPFETTVFADTSAEVLVTVGTQRFDPPRLHGQPVTEFVNVETASISFTLMASHAGNEFPGNIELQKKYAHLDWLCHEMIGVKNYTGILPQIWGIEQPLSSEVAAMLQPPSGHGNASGQPRDTCREQDKKIQ